MLDIREIREHTDAVRERLKARGGNHWTLIDEVPELRKKLLVTLCERLRAADAKLALMN